MPNFQAITRNRHANLRWQRHSTYGFAAQEAVAPLVAAEFPKALLSLPIAFLVAGESFQPYAVQGLTPGKNLLVAHDGRWLGGYTPAIYRGYPFRLATTEDGTQVLCIDEDSGLVSTGGELFFNDDGTPAKATLDILAFLTQVESNRVATTLACAALQKHQLIQPWAIKIQSAQGEQAVEGLHRIDEAALNQLSAEALLELRDVGALTMAYCQLLSMQHLPVLGQLAQANDSAAQQAAASAELDLEFLKNDGTISFGYLV